MKKTSQKLLLLLYNQDSQSPLRLAVTQVRWLLPELSLAGQRSLVYLLEKKGMIELNRLGETTWLNLTVQGKKALEAEFRALDSFWNNWTGEWTELVFLHSPKGDRQFRYLRQLALKAGALPLTRAVYLWPTGLTGRLLQVCQQLYSRSILSVELGAVAIGDLRPIIIKYYSLAERYTVYSSISRQINLLLNAISLKNELSIKEKTQFNLILEKIILVLADDLGLTSLYFPEVTRPIELIQQMQLIIKKIKQ